MKQQCGKLLPPNYKHELYQDGTSHLSSPVLSTQTSRAESFRCVSQVLDLTSLSQTIIKPEGQHTAAFTQNKEKLAFPFECRDEPIGKQDQG